MGLSTVDSKAALVVIDLQKGIVGMSTAQGSMEIVKRAAELARAFRDQNQTVVWVSKTVLRGVRGHRVTRDLAGTRSDTGVPRRNFDKHWRGVDRAGGV